MPQSRKELRLERRRAEFSDKRTVQYQQGHRERRPRRWMKNLKEATFRKLAAAILGGRHVTIHSRKRGGET